MRSLGSPFVILLCAVSLFGSFFVTLWLTEPESSGVAVASRSPTVSAEDLAKMHVPDDAALGAAAQAAGLYSSRRLQGNIDVIKRVNADDVTMSGWLADRLGDETSLIVLAFVNGTKVGAVQTKGERPDVTRALGLGFGAEKNVAFSFNFPCRSGDRAIVVGIGTKNQYLELGSPRCP